MNAKIQTTGKSVICNINVVNKEVYDVNVSISLSASSTPTDAEYIEYNKLVARNGGTIEKRGIALEAGRKIIVYASATGISINVYGYEE